MLQYLQQVITKQTWDPNLWYSGTDPRIRIKMSRIWNTDFSKGKRIFFILRKEIFLTAACFSERKSSKVGYKNISVAVADKDNVVCFLL